MDYEILPHTADIRIRASGHTLAALFCHALRGLSAVLQPEAFRRPPNVERVVAVTAPDTTQLLIDFLADTLVLTHIHREVYVDAQFEELTTEAVRAVLQGVAMPGLAEDVKAVTYHGAEVLRTDHGYEVIIIYDI